MSDSGSDVCMARRRWLPFGRIANQRACVLTNFDFVITTEPIIYISGSGSTPVYDGRPDASDFSQDEGSRLD